MTTDAGVSFHYNLPSNYGELHVGLYNGENYNRVEVNNEKALQIRGSVRPFAQGSALARGLRVHAFLDADNYVRSGERRRTDIGATFSNAYGVIVARAWRDLIVASPFATVGTPPAGNVATLARLPFALRKAAKAAAIDAGSLVMPEARSGTATKDEPPRPAAETTEMLAPLECATATGATPMASASSVPEAKA